ncbi:MAG: low molecular weight phosphotyrosine protein phosphatase [Anaerolineae bacterium]|nr:low molecular weight phosphotyrosine protein phosphatase [Anaerolineae bacterium]
MAGKTRILFVCLGNIVRSPLAENMFRHLAQQAGTIDRYELDSAGTSSYHVGDPPDERMQRVAAEKGLQVVGSSRQIVPEDLDQFDLLIAMDSSNYSHLTRMADGDGHLSKIHLMREWDPQGDAQAGVPDPWYGGIDGFERTFGIVERSCRGLLQALEAGELGD